MKQTICNAVHDAVKKDRPETNTSYKDLGFKDFDDMLHQIKTDFQTALWALSELESFFYWENPFIIDTTDDDYAQDIYQVGEFNFIIELQEDPFCWKLIPMKKETKMVEKTFWEVDNSIKI